jgi:DMSO/TMAO reductase YedYZ heme-binding membrane subunit
MRRSKHSSPAPLHDKKAVKVAQRRRRERVTYLICALILAFQFGVPRLWMIPTYYRTEIGDHSGYLVMFWLGFLLLMPTFARFLGGPWVRLMAVRKQLGVGIGVAILLHGFFGWGYQALFEYEVINPGGSGFGIIMFVLATVLLLTSWDRIRFSMRRKWWVLHQRVGTFALLWNGTMPANGSDRIVAEIACWFAYTVFVVRITQAYVDRRRYSRSDTHRNAAGFAAYFGFLVACEITGQFFLLIGLVVAGALMATGVVLVGRWISRRRTGARAVDPEWAIHPGEETYFEWSESRGAATKP